MDLPRFFREHPSGALAFSGGVDSALLVWAAARYGADWRAYYVRTPFQPAFELADARAVARQCGLPLTVIDTDVLADPSVAANPPERCYSCKRALFSAICRQAAADGYSLIIDGTNASDDDADRPGIRALRELSVRSPLRECGLTKPQIRALCRDAGLPVWEKPAYACLATRIPAGTPITRADLRRIEEGETILFSLGFRDLRLRLRDGGALLQLPAAQHDAARAQWPAILARLRPLFPQISLDPIPRPQ